MVGVGGCLQGDSGAEDACEVSFAEYFNSNISCFKRLQICYSQCGCNSAHFAGYRLELAAGV